MIDRSTYIIILIGLALIITAIFYAPAEVAHVNTNESMVVETDTLWENMRVFVIKNDTIGLKQYIFKHSDQILFLPESAQVEFIQKHDQYNLTKIRFVVSPDGTTTGWILTKHLTTIQKK